MNSKSCLRPCFLFSHYSNSLISTVRTFMCWKMCFERLLACWQVKQRTHGCSMVATSTHLNWRCCYLWQLHYSLYLAQAVTLAIVPLPLGADSCSTTYGSYSTTDGSYSATCGHFSVFESMWVYNVGGFLYASGCARVHACVCICQCIWHAVMTCICHGVLCEYV